MWGRVPADEAAMASTADRRCLCWTTGNSWACTSAPEEGGGSTWVRTTSVASSSIETVSDIVVSVDKNILRLEKKSGHTSLTD